MQNLIMVQQHLLGMMSSLDDFLESHGLDYCLIAGSALGAARHGGFIPWDDDIDIAMPRADYERLINLAGRLPSPLRLSAHQTDPNHPYGFIKIYDTTTSLSEAFIRPVRRGLWIDVFPLDEAPATVSVGLFQNLVIKRLNRLLRLRHGALRPNIRNRTKFLLLGWLVGLLPKTLPSRLLHAACHRRGNASMVGNYLSGYQAKEFFDASIYFPTRRVPFEGTALRVPAQLEQYLEGLYGNWRKLPPPERQVPGHDAIHAHLDRSYLGN